MTIPLLYPQTVWFRFLIFNDLQFLKLHYFLTDFHLQYYKIIKPHTKTQLTSFAL